MRNNSNPIRNLRSLNRASLTEIYPLEKQKANRETVWEHYFARKIAFLIVPILLRLGISANQVSFSSLTFGIIGTILIAIGNFWLILVGGILIQIWLILDKTDGIIARFQKTTNKFGEFFEELNGEIISALFFSSIGIAASKFPGFLPISFKLPLYFFIILGTLTSFFVIFRHLVFRYFEIIFKEKGAQDEFLSKTGLLSKIFVKFSGVYSLAQPIFILAIIFNFLGLYTLIYFLGQGLALLVSIFSLILKARYEGSN